MNRFENRKTIPRRISSGPAKIVSLLSGKGGVGKTVLVVNLAERMAALGARVLVVDADINCGNTHIIANTGCDYGFKEFIRGDLSIREAVVTTKYGFDLMAAGAGEPVFVDGDIKAIATTILNLRRNATEYDIIIMDHGSGISKADTVMAHGSDINIVTFVPELTSISDCYGLYKHLHRTDSAIEVRLMANRVTSEQEAHFVYGKLCAISERFVGQAPEFIGYISESRLFRESIATQTTLSGLNQQSAAIQELTLIAVNIFRGFGWPISAAVARTLSTEKTINETTAPADIRE
ncbi:MAG: AAA family ATPase [Candidatus Zixiibacteriota bacterium]